MRKGERLRQGKAPWWWEGNCDTIDDLMSISRSKGLILVAQDTARSLRKNQTPAEGVLWNALRNRGLEGRKFVRQHPILVEFLDKETFFVADFYCPAEHLVVELDGKVHDAQKIHDRERDSVLAGLGYRVLRIKNQEVEENLGKALLAIRQVFTGTHPPSPSLSEEREVYDSTIQSHRRLVEGSEGVSWALTRNVETATTPFLLITFGGFAQDGFLGKVF